MAARLDEYAVQIDEAPFDYDLSIEMAFESSLSDAMASRRGG